MEILLLRKDLKNFRVLRLNRFLVWAIRNTTLILSRSFSRSKPITPKHNRKKSFFKERIVLLSIIFINY